MRVSGAVTQYTRPFVQDHLWLCNAICFFSARFTTELVFAAFNVPFFLCVGPMASGPPRTPETTRPAQKKTNSNARACVSALCISVHHVRGLYCETKHPVTQSWPPQAGQRYFITNVWSLNGVLQKYCTKSKKGGNRNPDPKKTASNAESISQRCSHTWKVNKYTLFL